MIDQLIFHLTPPPPDPDTDQPKHYLYGIFNAEKYKNLRIKLENEWKVKHASLFEDEVLAISMNDVAPYLVAVPTAHPITKILLKHYGHGGTLFFWSTENFSQVLERMREFFVIYNPEGSKGYFTFYRPSMFVEIMREPSLMRDHYTQGIEAYFCEDEYDPNILYAFRKINTAIKQSNIKLTSEENL